ncbi:MAG: hypothetical protein ACJ735_03450 [Actinomycetes bacterium]
MRQRSAAVAVASLVCAVSALVVLVDLAQAAVQIHTYQDLDNEAGIASWHYHFGALQLAATVFTVLLVASLFALQRTLRSHQPKPWLSAPLVVALAAYVVVAAWHSKRLAYSGNDPWWSMKACVVALSIELGIAIALAVVALWPRHEDTAPR